MRKGEHKLIEFLDDGTVELYNLSKDVGEATDVSRQMPDTVAELRADLAAWRAEVGAKVPAS